MIISSQKRGTKRPRKAHEMEHSLYSKLSTLLKALDHQTVSVIHKCIHIGNQSLMQKNNGYDCLLMEACEKSNVRRVASLLAFKQHLNLNFLDRNGEGMLDHIQPQDYIIWHMILQTNISVSNFEIHKAGFCWSGFQNPVVYLMLLWAGANPKKCKKPHEIIIHNVRIWFHGLQCFKKLATVIFDNENLENEVLSFIYVEKNLECIVDLCKNEMIDVDTAFTHFQQVVFDFDNYGPDILETLISV